MAAVNRVTHIHSGSLWRDTAGNRIRAHGAGLLAVGRRYYWYGADAYRQPNQTRSLGRAPNRRINVLSSHDLYNWDAYSEAAFHDGCYVDRPKVIEAGGGGGHIGYIMWLKSTPFVAVATAVSPLGPFRLRARWRPSGEHVGDIGTFVDPSSGAAYLVYSVKPTAPAMRRVLHVRAMTPDRLNLTADLVSAIPLAREAPAAFHDPASGRYFLWTSRPSGWRANAAELFSAPSMSGPWQSMGNPTHSLDSFNSQGSYILPLPTPLPPPLPAATRHQGGRVSLQSLPRAGAAAATAAAASAPLRHDEQPVQSSRLKQQQRGLQQHHQSPPLPPPPSSSSSSSPPPRFVYVADRFDPWINTSESGRYVWLPLSIEGGRPVVRWRASWRVNEKT